MHDPRRSEQRGTRWNFIAAEMTVSTFMRAIMKRRRVEAQGLVENCVEIGEFFESETSDGAAG